MGPSFRLGGSTAFVTLHDRDGECLQAAEGVSGSAGVVEPALTARELLVAPGPAHGLVGLGARPLQIGPVQLGRLAVAVTAAVATARVPRSEEHTSELQSRG